MSHQVINKWNYISQEYNEHYVPQGHKVKLCDDMDELVNCANCGKIISFGDGYNSYVYHNNMGLGYAVCPKCHNDELKLDKEMKSLRYYGTKELYESGDELLIGSNIRIGALKPGMSINLKKRSNIDEGNYKVLCKSHIKDSGRYDLKLLNIDTGNIIETSLQKYVTGTIVGVT